MRVLVNLNYSNENQHYKLTLDDLNLESTHTGKCRFHVLYENNYEKKEIMVEDDKKSFLFDKPYEKIFFYGKEVNDFHSLDKNQIFALHHSAIQELDKKLIEKDEKIKSLESRLNTIESVVVTLQNK